MKDRFSFKIYTPIEGILMFVIALATTGVLLFFLAPYLGFQNWNPYVLKALLLLMTLLLFVLVRSVTTTVLIIEVDKVGIYFNNTVSCLGFNKQDKLITWTDLEEWQFQLGHLSSHSASPSLFSIRYLGGKKRTFYVADGEKNQVAFNTFLQQFQLKTTQCNIRNTNINPIEERNSLKQGKIFAFIMLFIWIGTPLGLIWYFFFKQPPVDNTGALIIISVVSIVGFGLSFKIIKDTFFS